MSPNRPRASKSSATFSRFSACNPPWAACSPRTRLAAAHPVALLANAYWRRQFNADPAIVGKAIELNGTPVTVVGVLPASFDFGAVFSPGAKVDLFTPLDLDQARDWGNIVTLLGRLKPGVTVAQALDDATARRSQYVFQR